MPILSPLTGTQREEIKQVIWDRLPYSDSGQREVIKFVVEKLVNDQQLQELMNEVVRIKRKEQP